MGQPQHGQHAAATVGAMYVPTGHDAAHDVAPAAEKLLGPHGEHAPTAVVAAVTEAEKLPAGQAVQTPGALGKEPARQDAEQAAAPVPARAAPVHVNAKRSWAMPRV